MTDFISKLRYVIYQLGHTVVCLFSVCFYLLIACIVVQCCDHIVCELNRMQYFKKLI